MSLRSSICQCKKVHPRNHLCKSFQGTVYCRFKIALGDATGVAEVAIELLRGTSPPLMLEGRAVFRQGESRTVNLPHIEEAIKFTEDISKDFVQEEVRKNLQKRSFTDLGPLEVSIGPATVAQDVKVVVPFEPLPEKKQKEPFFEEHPEVLATAMVLVLLLAGILVAMCWWILRCVINSFLRLFSAYFTELIMSLVVEWHT